MDFRLMIVNCGLLMGAEDGGFMFKGENGVIKKQRGKVRSLPVLETMYMFTVKRPDFVKGRKS